MKFTGIIVTIYGLLVVLGGLIGYLSAESLPSLIAGSVCGALLFAGGLGIYRYSVVAFFSSATISFLLMTFFTVRYFLSFKVMPAGIMSLLSLIIFLLILSTRGKPQRI